MPKRHRWQEYEEDVEGCDFAQICTKCGIIRGWTTIKVPNGWLTVERWLRSSDGRVVVEMPAYKARIPWPCEES